MRDAERNPPRRKKRSKRRVADVPAEVIQAEIDESRYLESLCPPPHLDQTVYWDASVPIHDLSSSIQLDHPMGDDDDDGYEAAEFTYDDDFITMLDDPTHFEDDVPLNDTSLPSGHRRQTSEISMIRRRQSREKISNRPKTPRRPASTVPSAPDRAEHTSDPEESVELGRGLNISKLCLQAIECHSEVVKTPLNRLGDSSPRLAPSPAHSSPVVEDVCFLDDGQAADDSEANVEPAGRIKSLCKDGVFHGGLQWHESDQTQRALSPNSPIHDQFGFMRAEELIKGECPASPVLVSVCADITQENGQQDTEPPRS